MIESSVNQVALQQKQANISDIALNQHQQEAKSAEKTIEEASNNPVGQNGVANSNLHNAAVSNQPPDVVTRLGEPNESISLYQPTHQPTGKIIRPEISNEQAQEVQAKEAQAQVQAQTQAVQDEIQVETQAKPTNPQSWATDTNQLVGN